MKYLVIVYEPTQKEEDLKSIQKCFEFVKANSLEIQSPVLIIENYKSKGAGDMLINNRDIDSMLQKLEMEYVFYITSFFKDAHTEDAQAFVTTAE